MTPSADESVKVLTQKLKDREPFVFTKFGDGDLYWMSGNPVPIAGGETFRSGISMELRKSAYELACLEHTWFGDQLTCGSGPYMKIEQDSYLAYVRGDRWLHFESLLIHRLSPELLEFYRTLRDRESKVCYAGKHLTRALKFLDALGLRTISRESAHSCYEPHMSTLQNVPWDILLLSAGRASKMIAAKLAPQFPDRTIIELGSALDPLFVGRTRSEQIDPAEAREYFKELL